jgi:hypothetical protein
VSSAFLLFRSFEKAKRDEGSDIFYHRKLNGSLV